MKNFDQYEIKDKYDNLDLFYSEVMAPGYIEISLLRSCPVKVLQPLDVQEQNEFTQAANRKLVRMRQQFQVELDKFRFKNQTFTAPGELQIILDEKDIKSIQSGARDTEYFSEQIDTLERKDFQGQINQIQKYENQQLPKIAANEENFEIIMRTNGKNAKFQSDLVQMAKNEDGLALYTYFRSEVQEKNGDISFKYAQFWMLDVENRVNLTCWTKIWRWFCYLFA